MASVPIQWPTPSPSPPPARSAPDLQRHRDMYLSWVWRNVDRKKQVDAIMREHDFGTFYRSAAYVDELLTDDRIDGVLSTRIDALLASRIQFEPATDKRLARRAAEAMRGEQVSPGVTVIGTWEEIIRPSAVRELLKWGLMLGVGVAEIVWDRGPKSWRPRLVPWHPQFLRWDSQRNAFVMQTMDGEVQLPRPDEQPFGDGKWFLYCPYGVRYGWRSALIRSLALKYISREWNEQSWDRYCEKHGLAIIEAKVPANALKEETDAFFDQVANLGAEGTVVSPQGDKDQGSYGIGLVEATARTWETFQARKKEIDTDIAIAVLGQNLTTDVQGGSRAAAQVHNLVRLDKAMRDAAFANDVRSQVLTHWAHYNLGDAELAPYPEYRVMPEEDSLQKANAYKALGDAVISLQTAEPRVDGTAIIEGEGIPLISEEELAAQEAVAAEEAANNPPPPPQGGDPAGGGQQPNAAESQDGAVKALMALANRADGTAVMLRTNVAGGKKATLYQDRILKRSQRIAAQSLAVDLAKLKSEIDAAISWDDLRDRIRRAFRGMDPHRLAKVIEKTNILAHMSGRLQAVKEI